MPNAVLHAEEGNERAQFLTSGGSRLHGEVRHLTSKPHRNRKKQCNDEDKMGSRERG